jgi:hypothetical protein
LPCCWLARPAQVTQRVSVSWRGLQSELYGHSSGAAISADGRYVAYHEHGTHLVPGDTQRRVRLSCGSARRHD